MVDIRERKKIANIFHTLGLDKLESHICTELFIDNKKTILELSKLLNCPRTNVYRATEKLVDMGILNKNIYENRVYLEINKIDYIEQLLEERIDKLKQSRNDIVKFEKQISQSGFVSQPLTNVRFYKGVEGIKQLVWNVLSTKTELVGYTYRRLDEVLGSSFVEHWDREFVSRGLKGRDIYSNEYLKSVQGRLLLSNTIESAYIDESIYNIDHQVDIYNNTLAFYSWHAGEVFGVEIENEKIANLQRSLFELVWEKAIPEKELVKLAVLDKYK